MGLLRFILAMCVVNVHAGLSKHNLLPADSAVQAFYMISGYYMAMVLNEKYRHHANCYSDFIRSRILRIFPAYIAILVITIGTAYMLSLIGIIIPPMAQWTEYLSSGKWITILQFIPQATLIGVDAMHFVTIDHTDHIAFTSHFLQAPVQFWKGLAVPQCWTLSVEFYFYLIAPFLVLRSKKFHIIVILSSFAIRSGIASTFNLTGDPWSYRFFPSELMYFMCGSLAYGLQSTNHIHKINWASSGMRLVAFVAIIGSGMIARSGLSEHRMIYPSTIIVAIIFLGIPLLFQQTKNWKIDRYIGNLSYPIYISHMLVIWICDITFKQKSILHSSTVCISVIMLSILIYEWIDKRADRYRQRKFAYRR